VGAEPAGPTSASPQYQRSVTRQLVDNIGDKTFTSTTGYATYAAQHIY
jgi:hypothetical protein